MSEGGHRRSARLSALETSKAQVEVPQQNVGRKRGRKKRRLRAVEEVVVNSVEKDDDAQEVTRENPKENENPCNSGLPSNAPSPTPLPEKQVLELVLDTLQKRDKNEIFAEPVDPKEVEDYYEVIANPMDLATMRAKLQEAKYTTLEQFEKDVFLISENAMAFNAPSTVYYRQARAIEELSKKIFHTLRTEPENFELVFSKSRRSRRFMTKPLSSIGSGRSQDEAGGSSTKPRNSSMIGRQYLLNGLAGSRRNLHSSPLANNHRASKDLAGFREGKRSIFLEDDPRSTYRNWNSFLTVEELTASTLCNKPGQLLYVNQGNFNYKESLMRFAADLGPTAQRVALRKLQECENRGKMHHAQAALALHKPVTPNPTVSVSTSHHIPMGNSSCSQSVLANSTNQTHLPRQTMGESSHQGLNSNILSCSYIPTTRIGKSDFHVSGMDNSVNGYLESIFSSGIAGNHVLPSETNPGMASVRVPVNQIGSGMANVNSLPRQIQTVNASTQVPRSEFGSVAASIWVPPSEFCSDVASAKVSRSEFGSGIAHTTVLPSEFGSGMARTNIPPSDLCSGLTNTQLPQSEFASGMTSIRSPLGDFGSGVANIQLPPSEFGSGMASIRTLPTEFNCDMSSNHIALNMFDSSMAYIRVPPSEPADSSQSGLLEFVSRNHTNTNRSWPSQATKALSSIQGVDCMHGLQFALHGESQAGSVPELRHPFGPAHMFPVSTGSHPGLWGQQSVLDGVNQAAATPEPSRHLGRTETGSSSTVTGSELRRQRAIFDLPFLQSRIHEMGSWGRNGVSKPPELPSALVQETTFVNEASASERDSSHSQQAKPNSRHFLDLLDKPHPDLALQL